MVRPPRGTERIQPAAGRRTTRAQARAANPVPAPTYAALLEQQRPPYTYSALHHHPPMAPRSLSFSVTPHAGAGADATPFAVWAPAFGTGGPKWCMWCFQKRGGILYTLVRDIGASVVREISVNGNNAAETWHHCREEITKSDKCTRCQAARISGCVWEYDQMSGDFYDVKVMNELVRILPDTVRQRLLPTLLRAWDVFGTAVELHKADESGGGGPFPFYAISYKWNRDDEAKYLVQANLRRQANGLAYLRVRDPGYNDWSAAKASFVEALSRIVSEYRQASQEDLRVIITLDEARNSYAF